MVDFPALPLKQNLDAMVTEAYSGSSEVSDSSPQTGLDFVMATLLNHRPTDSKNSAGSSLANFKADLQVTDKVLPDGRLQSIFAITSCSIALSRARTATSCLSFRFSSSRSLRRRSSAIPDPAYYRFHR